MAERFQNDFPESASSPASIARVVSTGKPLLVPRLSEAMIRHGARDETHRAAIASLGVRSLMLVPITVRGRSLGTLTFARSESARDYTQADLRLAEAVASRAGLVLDNAFAYDAATQANRLKDEFLATLSHELRTPLNAVLGYSRMLNTGTFDTARTSRAMAIIERNATALNTLVRDILDVSAIVSGKMILKREPVDLRSILDLALAGIRPAAEAKSLTVRVAHGDVPPLAGDADRLQQVFWNLLSNAVKFTPEGGEVRVAVALAGPNAEIVVSDTGRGIDAAFLPHVFDRFRQQDARFTREHGGLGLGLAIARDLIALHGGRIAVASEGAGLGASFTVTLPVLLADDPRPPEPRVVVAPSRLDGVNVLAVDDQPDALALMREVLQAAGATVVTAASAHEGLQALETGPADVIVSDIAMPGASGVDFIRQVRESERFRAVPALALSAYAEPHIRTEALAAGFQAHLTKPADAADIVGVIHQLTREPRTVPSQLHGGTIEE